MHVLVTGGFGFLGRAVITTLTNAGHDVTVLSHDEKPQNWWNGGVVAADLRDRHSVDKALKPLNVDGVCHLAGLTAVRDSFVNPLEYYEVNVAGTINLLRALTKEDRPLPFVFASTCAVYGSAEGRLSEELPVHPESPYASTKASVENLLSAVAETGKLSAISLRFFNIAGAAPDQPPSTSGGIIPMAFRAARGEIPQLTLNGDGTTTREFTHVLDAAHAVQRALSQAQQGKSSVVNVGTGEGVTLNEIIKTVETMTARPISVKHGPPASEPQFVVADTSRIREWGWTPRRSSMEQIVGDAWRAWNNQQA